MTCPDCHGTGKTILDHATYADGRHGYHVEVRCSQCDGKATGVVPQVVAKWIETGEQMRHWRLRNYPVAKARVDRLKNRRPTLPILTRGGWRVTPLIGIG